MGALKNTYVALAVLGVVIAFILLTGCQTTGGSFCDIAKPIRPSADTIAQLTDAEVAAILAHNQKGAALCGWKA